MLVGHSPLVKSILVGRKCTKRIDQGISGTLGKSRNGLENWLLKNDARKNNRAFISSDWSLHMVGRDTRKIIAIIIIINVINIFHSYYVFSFSQRHLKDRGFDWGYAQRISPGRRIPCILPLPKLPLTVTDPSKLLTTPQVIFSISSIILIICVFLLLQLSRNRCLEIGVERNQASKVFGVSLEPNDRVLL